LHPTNVPPTVFYVCSVGESGLLYSWDIRSPNTPVERVQAHVGGATCLDWRSASDNTTWIATGGLDNTVKIWQHAPAGLSSRPLHTLATSHPTQAVCWRPQRQMQLLVTPLYTSASVETDSSSSTLGSDIDTDTVASWSNELELWDVTRPWTYDSVLRSGDGAVSGALTSEAFAFVTLFLACATTDEDICWTLHRTTGLFAQRRINDELLRPLASLPSAASAWSVRGELAFFSAPAPNQR
jgi:WD40 repeat protein